MNTDIKDIGLVIWGCKGGYRIFCSNVVNVNEKDISDTLKDIRNYVYVQRHGIDYYAVEFSSRYKVYTHYRSSNDSGSGAFIAITLFVPHTLMITNVREVLDELVNKYFREYVNPLNGTPLPGKFDEIRPFQNLLEATAKVVPDRRMLRFSTSVQNNIPKIVKYDDLSTVDRYFDNPYHREFFDCQEVMFFRRDLIDRRADFQISFSREPEIIEKVSEPEPMNRLIAPDSPDVAIASLSVNGHDCTASISKQGVNPGDRVAITFSQEYHSPRSVDGTVEELVRQGILARRGDDYRIVPPRLTPVNYYLFIEAEGMDAAALYPHLRLSSNVAGVIEATATEKGPAFVMPGIKVTAEYRVVLIPDAKAREGFNIDKCRPLEMIKVGANLRVQARELAPAVEIPAGLSPEIKAEVQCNGVTIEVPFRPGQKLAAPVDATVSLRSSDGKFELRDRTYHFIPSSLPYRIELPHALNALMLDIDGTPVVEIDGKTYQVKGTEVRLPNPLPSPQLVLACRGPKKSFRLPLASLGGDRLTPSATIINNKSGYTVVLMTDGSVTEVDPRAIMHGSPGINVAFKNPADVNDLTLTASGDDNLRIFTISPRDVKEETPDGENAASGGKHDKKSGKEVKVLFRNFSNYLVDGQKVADGKELLLDKKTPVRISTLKNKYVATIMLADGGRSDSKEFEVKGDGKVFIVTYRPTFVSRAVDVMTSKVAVITLCAVVVAGLAVGAWFLFRSTESVYNIHLRSADKITSLKPLDTAAGLVTPLDTVLRFSRKEAPVTVTGKERVVVTYGAEGSDTLSLEEIVRGPEYSDLQTFLKSEKPAALTDLTVTLGPSPASRFYDEIKDNVNDSTVALFAGRYAGSRRLAALNDTLAAFKKAEAEKIAVAEAEAAKAAADKAAHDAVAKPYLALVNKLNSMDCTKADVDAIDAYATAHKSEITQEIRINQPKVDAYRKFFDKEQAIAPLTRYFSLEQQKACKYYNSYWNIHKKNDPERNFRYAAQKAKEMGIL